MLSLLAEKVMQRCDALAKFTEIAGETTRRFLSPPVHDVHASVRQWMVQLGMEVRVDAIGNIVGRRLAQRGKQTRALIIGSHLDTVPNAGRYDGILGVMIGLAIVESLGKADLPFAIDVIGFSEEEGVRYSQPYLGSRAVAGTFDRSWLDRVDDSSLSMRDAMNLFGLSTDEIEQAAYDPTTVIGFLEVHIEQGRVLEQSGHHVGIVDSIIGQSRLQFEWNGEAGHAGTAPMEFRRDALVGAARLVQTVRELGKQIEGIRATVGKLNVLPNASNVIPSQVTHTLDIRHVSDQVRLSAVDSIVEAGNRIAREESLFFKTLHRYDSNSVFADQTLLTLLREAVVDSGQKPFTMQSGAGHDAVIMAEKFPMAMLFVRHPGGVSHHPSELVEVEDVAHAITVVEHFIKQLSARVRN